jgi:cytochrome c oxidase subunit II
MKRILFLAITIFSFNCFADFPRPWQINFQDPVTPVMEELIWLHDLLLIIITLITVFVLLLLAYTSFRYSAKRNPIPATFTHNITIEVIWTIIPVLILVLIAIPSFKAIAKIEKAPPAEMTIKVVGAQWYWTYSYPDHGGFSFDSNMIQTKDLQPGQHRLLEVDNRIVIPENTVVKFLITGADVIHSFAVPALGVKMDAIPGIVNHTWAKVTKKGVYYGQCSEICGIKHGFMPIAVEVVSKEDFDKWIEEAKKKFAANSKDMSIFALAN